MVDVTDGRRSMGGRELIALLALMISTAALGVDIILPAFSDIRADFGLAETSTAAAAIVTTYLFGLGVGMIPWGLIADRFGRKKVVYAGLALYVVGAAASALAPSLTWLLVARFIWGLGASGPRTVTLSIVRDTYDGERMARAMSFIIAIFILVPVVAPSIGALITDWISWRGAIAFTFVVAAGIGLWSLRLPETLRPENTLRLTVRDIARAGKLVVTTRVTVGYMLVFTVLFGAFMSYIASSELIFSDVYGFSDEFPLIFGGLAIGMGVGALLNSWLVSRVGLDRLIRVVMVTYLVFSAALFALAVATDGAPPFWIFAILLGLTLSTYSLVIPNINTAAMAPMARIAGTASAIIGTVATAGGALLGSVIDQAYDGTVIPLTFGFLISSLAAWLLSLWAGAGVTAASEKAVA